MRRPIKGPAGFVAAVALLLAGLGVATSVGLAAHSASSMTRRVTVTEREYRITLVKHSLMAGMTTFVVVNRGKVAHEFEIRGPGLANKRIPGKIAPGATKRLTVRLRKGRYTLLCPIHFALGMKTTITAGGTATSGAMTTTGSSWG